MHYIILVTTSQYKARTAVCGLHLVCSRHFTHESVFYTESVMLGLRGTAIDHFHFRNNEMEDIVVYQSNRLAVELLLCTCKHFCWVYITYFRQRNLRPAKLNYAFPDSIYSAQSHNVFSQREEGTQNATKVFCSYDKSYPFHEDISERF